MRKDAKIVVWLGDSRAVLRSFPKLVREKLGGDLRRLQLGKVPLDSKPMKTVGPGVRELRARDRNNQYRVMYTVRSWIGIVVLHSFAKKSRVTPRSDIDLARGRLRAFDRHTKGNSDGRNYHER